MRLFYSTIKVALLAVVAAAFLTATSAEAAPVTVFNANVNEWSSSTPSDPTDGIYPIGGSGEINGGFVVTTGSDGAQIGL